MEEKIVLIDTDCGLDDAVALYLAVAAHKNPNHNFRVVGISCVNGNTTVDNVCINVTRVLQLLKAEEIPIFRGCEHPIIGHRKDLEDPPFYGHDGFGDCDFPVVESMHCKNENAVSGIIRLAHEFKGMGNVTMNAEFNFLVDPEAACITLSSFFCPIFILPWEVVRKGATQEPAWRMEVLGKLGTPQCELMNSAEEKYFDRICEYEGGWLPCDALCAALLIDPNVIKSTAKYFCSVELGGIHTRGQMIVDHPRLSKKTENVTVIKEVETAIFKKMLTWAFGGEYYQNEK